jgi:hypothetical protein
MRNIEFVPKAFKEYQEWVQDGTKNWRPHQGYSAQPL